MLKQNLILGAMLAFTFFVYAEEELTITTYYPSPYGSYRELRAQRVAIGGTYYDTSQYCWSPDTCTNRIPDAASLVVEGNVGIGTTSPSRKLQISESTSNSVYLQIGNSVTGTTGIDGMSIGVDPDGSADLWQWENNYLKIGTNNIERMRIDSSGNVGIGTTGPTQTLDVNGLVRIRGGDPANGKVLTAIDTNGNATWASSQLGRNNCHWLTPSRCFNAGMSFQCAAGEYASGLRTVAGGCPGDDNNFQFELECCTP